MILALHGPKGRTEIEAWTLNVSRGGLRVVVEDAVHVDGTYLVTVGDSEARPAKVVWLREEADGQIAGLKFEDVQDAEVPPSSFPPPA